jgi:hypothetical protein
MVRFQDAAVVRLATVVADQHDHWVCHRPPLSEGSMSKLYEPASTEPLQKVAD